MHLEQRRRFPDGQNALDLLAAAKLHAGITIPLEMFNGRVVDTDVEGVDTRKYAHITATLESPFTAKAIGLVRGGWLPSALAATRETAVILPDRNIITEISGRFDEGRRQRAFNTPITKPVFNDRTRLPHQWQNRRSKSRRETKRLSAPSAPRTKTQRVGITSNNHHEGAGLYL
ncbi:hypothetical protein [Stakelama tenebrarum]|uniref:Uncharacterized protein n=1 Tax=Stakelama tenebrarum TaxID=2711215 RepID=A0A6G6Y606_9SPHN|nr:hypothetical protein [Sphingosinithalassobacter tenebrarum]QIG80384.1 hypothetical protein G5C33_11755 [Sphingosinithalassobacter tenebrarum]